MKFEVSYSYQEPRWGTIELEAETADEAEKLAVDELKRTFPEVEEFEIDEVKELNA